MTKDIYVADIPGFYGQDLYTILTANNVWEKLAIAMQYQMNEIEDMREAHKALNMQPGEYLIQLWGDANHTVSELFVVLYRIRQYRAMNVLKKLVDPKYHILLETSEKILNVSKLESRECNESESPAAAAVATLTNPNNQQNNQKNTDEILHIDYYELRDATDNWNTNNILGSGGFGTVYKGLFKETVVAIKRIEDRGKNSSIIAESLAELKHLNSCRHDNILPVYGHSTNGKHHCLVYQYMSGRSLDQRIFKPTNIQILNWHQRIDIAIGTAKGLQYLHTFREKPLIHGDIKPANIMLDPCNQPKIGDFGMAREGKKNDEAMEVSKISGTKPYLPVEYLHNHTLTTKVDTFSFGVVLFELVTALRAYDSSHKFLSKYILNAKLRGENLLLLMDKSLPSIPQADIAFSIMIDIGLCCTNEKHEHRPEMLTVYRELKNRFSYTNKD